MRARKVKNEEKEKPQSHILLIKKSIFRFIVLPCQHCYLFLNAKIRTEQHVDKSFFDHLSTMESSEFKYMDYNQRKQRFKDSQRQISRLPYSITIAA